MIFILKIINFLCLIFLFQTCNSNERKFELFYPDGKLRVSGTYIDEKAHGFWEGYYSNGQLKSSGEYNKGKLVGRWVWYYEDGTKLKDSIFSYPNFNE